MPVISGQKYACQSCIKGHRVSNCNHFERPLTIIARKGRPIKQCEHCRGARKSKSHHAKCDCGHKKEKDKAKNDMTPPVTDGCCCYKGSACVCGSKGEGIDFRLEKSLNRPTPAVKCKPRSPTESSDKSVNRFGNGPHKPVHRSNNSARTTSAPYKIPRPHTLHGAPAFTYPLGSVRSAEVPQERASDDMFVFPSHGNVGGPTSPTTSDESFNQSPTHESEGEVWPSLLGTSVEDLQVHDHVPWHDTPNSLVSGDSIPMDMSSWPDLGWNEYAPASGDFFSPSDLPLIRGQLSPCPQPISHSGESSYQSAPGMTTSSSGAHSETGEAFSNDGLWSDTIQVRENAVSLPWSQDPLPENIVSLEAMGRSPNIEPHPGTEFSSAAAMLARATGPAPGTVHEHRISECSSSSGGTAKNMNMSHDSDDAGAAIFIPAETEDGGNEWNWNNPVPPVEMAKEFGWLVDP